MLRRYRRRARKPVVTATLPRVRSPRPARHVTFHPDGRGGLLFDARAQQVYGLDRAGAYLWCALAEGHEQTRVAHDYASLAEISLYQAMAHLCALIDRWRKAGLLQRDDVAADEPHSAPRSVESIPRGVTMDGVLTVACRLAGCDIAVRFDDRAQAALCRPLLERLEGPPPRRWHAVLDVSRGRRGGAVLCAAGRHPMTVLQPNSLPPAVLAALSHMALRHGTGFPAVHAALIAGPRGGLLLPAPSGRGKSTLSAGLMASGFDTLCDDTVILDRGALTVSPLLPYLCIKAGAWPAIGGRLPGLWRHRAWRRPDGHHVRYVPTANHVNGNCAVPVSTMVFPRYDAGAETQLTPLSAAEALERLLPCIDPLGRRFDGADIDRLIAWVSGAACYDLTHRSLEDGIAAIREAAA